MLRDIAEVYERIKEGGVIPAVLGIVGLVLGYLALYHGGPPPPECYSSIESVTRCFDFPAFTTALGAGGGLLLVRWLRD
jgi:hypothetical protein